MPNPMPKKKLDSAEPIVIPAARPHPASFRMSPWVYSPFAMRRIFSARSSRSAGASRMIVSTACRASATGPSARSTRVDRRSPGVRYGEIPRLAPRATSVGTGPAAPASMLLVCRSAGSASGPGDVAPPAGGSASSDVGRSLKRCGHLCSILSGDGSCVHLSLLNGCPP
jgi:hypothetical protein